MDVRPGYKQTEVGVIPEDWEIKPLHALADKIMVGIASAATHAYRKQGVVMFRNQNIKPGYLDDMDVLYIDEAYEETYRNKRLKAGDLLTARTGYPGTTSIVPAQYEGAQSFTTLITRPRQSLVDSEYLCCFINSEVGQTYFEQNQIGGGQKNVNAGSLKHLAVPLPPTKAEQEAIAGALGDADALIESLEQLLTKKRQIKKGAMQELLTGKKRLPGFSGEWEVKRLGDIIEKFVGGGTPSRSNSKYWGSEIPWVTVKDFATFSPSHSQEAITKVGLQNSAAHLIPKGTLITSTRMALGKAVVYDVDVAINQDLKAFFPKPVLATQYLYFWFQYHEQSIDELGSGSTVKGISLPDLKKIEFQLPPSAEQTAIATILSDMDAEIAALEAKLSKARQLKQGMMQELLTGRIRLI